MNENDEQYVDQVVKDKIAGIELPEPAAGWGDYPLDSVFVRQEQRTVAEIIGRIEKGRYILAPDFQRDFVWSPTKQSRLIESCLMRIPLPVFYLAEASDGKIIIVDGLQRLITFQRYINNNFPLIGLGDEAGENAPKSTLNSKRFDDLPLNLQERLEDTQLILYILDVKAPERAKLDIFERVNGGVPLTRQQMRNCLFNGQATRWLKKMADSQLFLKVTGGSLDKKSMRDREAINRFCAFRILGELGYKGDMDDFLAKSLKAMNSLPRVEILKLYASFLKGMRFNDVLFGEHAFRKSLADTRNYVARTVINISLFDVCTVILSGYSRDFVLSHSIELREAIRELFYNDEFITSITYSTNSTKAVLKRFSIMRNALQEVSAL
ncbi:MAG: DUF262 domain-containing protein [Syntrophobacteraceae bacterium]